MGILCSLQHYSRNPSRICPLSKVESESSSMPLFNCKKKKISIAITTTLLMCVCVCLPCTHRKTKRTDKQDPMYKGGKAFFFLGRSRYEGRVFSLSWCLPSNLKAEASDPREVPGKFQLLLSCVPKGFLSLPQGREPSPSVRSSYPSTSLEGTQGLVEEGTLGFPFHFFSGPFGL